MFGRRVVDNVGEGEDVEKSKRKKRSRKRRRSSDVDVIRHEATYVGSNEWSCWCRGWDGKKKRVAGKREMQEEDDRVDRRME
uniref:Uncharacterized protein n=1 Tax=Vespula pensylvanica TaxID=30213 RepID=A0A834U8X5_VESPE|nr:hypothetical protein H0235_009923 [Vespula pensylvanica]